MTRPEGDAAEDPWKQGARSVLRHTREHQLSLIGAGVAFFGLLSIAPAMIAVVSVYGLVASPAEVAARINDLDAVLPSEARRLVADQLEQVVHSSSTGLSAALVIGAAIAVWSASSAIKQLLVALSAVYDVAETRRFVRLHGRALLISLGALAFASLSLLVLTVLPRWIGEETGGGVRTAVAIARWPLLAALMMGALAIVYRYGPDRPPGRWAWWSWGAAAASVSWLLASAVFSAYVTHFGSYNKTYGALGAVVVLMLWLYLTVLCVLVGGEINAELDRHSARTNGIPADAESASTRPSVELAPGSGRSLSG